MREDWEFYVKVCPQEQNHRRKEHICDLNKELKKCDHSFSAKHEGKRHESLSVGDYFLVARNKESTKEYVLMVIERKTCKDAFRSLRTESSGYKGQLYRMDAQMRQLYSVGDNVVKLLLIEGHEKTLRLKTFRKRFHGYYPGVNTVQTESLEHSIEFICDQLEAIKRLFENNQVQAILSLALPCPNQIKVNVRAAMSKGRIVDPIFTRYLDLIKELGLHSYAQAMKTIKEEYPGTGFICPTLYGEHERWSKTGKQPMCKDYSATYYNREDYVSRFFSAVARGDRCPTIAPVHVAPNFYKRQRQNRQDQFLDPGVFAHSHHEVVTGEVADIIRCAFEAVFKNQRVKDLGSEDPGNQQFDFGKHKGETFEEVALTDPTYIDRYMRQTWKPKEAQEKLRNYIAYYNSYGRYLAAHPQGNQREGGDDLRLTKRRRRTSPVSRKTSRRAFEIETGSEDESGKAPHCAIEIDICSLNDHEASGKAYHSAIEIF